MSRRATFTKAELSRAVKGVTETGIGVVRVEILPDGKIIIITAGTAPEPSTKAENEWDTVK